MALSIVACVWRSTNRLVYQMNQSGNANPETLPIPNAGGASPDLMTDALLGLQQFGPPPLGTYVSLYRLLRARIDGWGPIPAGGLLGPALTQDQGRALLMGWDQSHAVITNPLIPYAVTCITPIASTDALAWSVDVEINGSGDPNLSIETNAFGSANNRGQALVEIEMHFTP